MALGTSKILVRVESSSIQQVFTFLSRHLLDSSHEILLLRIGRTRCLLASFFFFFFALFFLDGSRGACYPSARLSTCLLALLLVLALTSPLWVPRAVHVHMLVGFTSKAFAFIPEPLSFFI